MSYEYQGKVIVPITVEQRLLAMILDQLIIMNNNLDSIAEAIPMDEKGNRKFNE